MIFPPKLNFWGEESLSIQMWQFITLEETKHSAVFVILFIAGGERNCREYKLTNTYSKCKGIGVVNVQIHSHQPSTGGPQ